MAQVKPLRLKVQRAQSVQKFAPDGQSTVEVLVDTGVFHIDNFFSYAVPPNLSEDIEVGQRVSVPFGKQTLEGLIITLGSTPSDSPLKYISFSNRQKDGRPTPLILSDQRYLLVLQVLIRAISQSRVHRGPIRSVAQNEVTTSFHRGKMSLKPWQSKALKRPRKVRS
jgi:hypothetical protein